MRNDKKASGVPSPTLFSGSPKSIQGAESLAQGPDDFVSRYQRRESDRLKNEILKIYMRSLLQSFQGKSESGRVEVKTVLAAAVTGSLILNQTFPNSHSFNALREEYGEKILELLREIAQDPEDLASPRADRGAFAYK